MKQERRAKRNGEEVHTGQEENILSKSGKKSKIGVKKVKKSLKKSSKHAKI